MLESLEIVNQRINYIKDGVMTISITLEQLETIKQDLEVLEIIKNKQVQVYMLKLFIDDHEDDKEILFYYNKYGCLSWKLELTMEELIKLEQCLLSNKVGDNHE